MLCSITSASASQRIESTTYSAAMRKASRTETDMSGGKGHQKGVGIIKAETCRDLLSQRLTGFISPPRDNQPFPLHFEGICTYVV